MTIAFVVGNGCSRGQIDISKLASHGTVYACNAAYRDFFPDYLVAVDKKMVLEIVEESHYPRSKVWTNAATNVNHINGINYFEPCRGWSSGPSALLLASDHGHEAIYILGFDYHGLDNNTKNNNVYAGTRNYRPVTALPTFCGNWLNQTHTVLQEFPKVKYIRVASDEQFMPEWKNVENFQHMSIDAFKTSMKC